MKAFAAALALACGAGRAGAQAHVQVGPFDLVPVDVNVIGKSGRPVPDQAAGDFTLTVDGKPRRLRAVHFGGPRRRPRASGSHRTLSRPDRPDFVFAFHDGEELGPRILARIAKHTGLTSGDL
jgi:hypothetical protein